MMQNNLDKSNQDSEFVDLLRRLDQSITYLFYLCLCFVFVFLILTTVAYSAQLIAVSDDAEVKATISSYEINRIKIQNGRITGFRALEGDIIANSDSKKGEIFINLPGKRANRATNLFITSESGATFKLLLIPKNIPAEQIFLIEQGGNIGVNGKKGVRIYDNYRDSLIKFYRSLYRGEALDDYKISYRKRRHKSPISGIKVTRIANYQPRDSKNRSTLHGQIFTVKNHSKEFQILDPKDFYEDGIRAIKLDRHILGKGESTKMYVIKLPNKHNK